MGDVMARYRALSRGWTPDTGIVEAGTEFSWDGPHGTWMEPLDGEAKKAKKEGDARRAAEAEAARIRENALARDVDAVARENASLHVRLAALEAQSPPAAPEGGGAKD